MIGRVRELKQWLDASFYHPGVLATVSAYNTAFGKKFDELFVRALGEIKNFGQALEEMGGTILTTVDGVEVTVEHVAAIEEKQLLQADYGSTFEKFRRVSKLKKELDRRPPIRRSLLTPARTDARGRGKRSRRNQGCQSCGGKGSCESSRVSAARDNGATTLGRREQTAPRRRIDSCVCARGRPQVSSGGPHAVLQPDAHRPPKPTRTTRLFSKKRACGRMWPER